ncbi:MAG: LptA/OstA family protein [Treponemataceae bacterium]|nr:LptA/OstA family protein [Treponemataceae bacterium]
MYSFFRKFSIYLLCFLSTITFLFAENISFSADKMLGSTGEDSQFSKLEGNAYIKTEKMEIRADQIILSGEDFRFITAIGKITGKSEESDFDFSCEQLDYDRDTEIVVLKGNVSLIDNENEVKASAQLIEFNQKSEIANMQIDVKLIQKKNTCTGASALYNKGEQTLRLTGSPQVVKDQDTFKANEIYMNLDTEEITLDGKVRGSVTDESSSDKKDEKKPENKAQPKKESER